MAVRPFLRSRPPVAGGWIRSTRGVGRRVNDPSSTFAALSGDARRVLAAAPTAFEGRRAIEGYVDRLNRMSPVAERSIVSWGRAGPDRLAVGAVLNGMGGAGPEVFLGECHFGFGLALVTRSPSAAPATYVVGLPLSGQLSLTLRSGNVLARAGEGLVFDPAEVERTEVSAGAHLVEFHLPRRELQRLAVDWAPGLEQGRPSFSPRLVGSIPQRLLFMAAQAAQVLQAGVAAGTSGGTPRGTPDGITHLLYQRWVEMISLTLLQEQTTAALRKPGATGPTPPSVRRALDFMQAHADSAIGLADIAEAACTSASSLLRHFQAHLGLAPAAYLRRVRLERARADLQASHSGPIRDIALRWGFQNASKFSAAYLSHFGERPSDVRARPAGAAPARGAATP